MMLGLEKDGEPSAKCYVTHGPLAQSINPNQSSTKKQPFSALQSEGFVQEISLLLPKSVYDACWDKTRAGFPKLKYHVVRMRLEELLSGDFFTQYIKIGNVLMISEGRPGVEDKFALRDGLLSMYVDKATYERIGIVGKPIGSQKTKRAKARWLVTVNLRLPSMLHGKRAFERLLWACRNVLNEQKKWLFYDLATKPGTVVESLNSISQVIEPTITQLNDANVPSFANCLQSTLPAKGDNNHICQSEDMIDVYEWLNLALLESPRIHHADVIDPLLSRYQAPDTGDGLTTEALVKASFSGLLPSSFAAHMFAATLITIRFMHPNSWFAISARPFPTEPSDDGRSMMVLRYKPVLKYSETGDDMFCLWQIA